MKKLTLILIILIGSILRFYKLDSNPPSLNWDEVSLGYNAYSILKTGHDEHGRFMPMTNFGAFGDYKPPGYIYATMPSIALFGLNELAVRFPSAAFGVLTVAITYFLTKKLFEKEKIARVSALLLAISPWHLQFSRAAFESNLALFFSTAAIYLFVKFKDRPIFIFPSLMLFLLAMYTFTGQRLFVPFILIILFIQFKNKIFNNIKYVFLAGTIFIILFYPLFKFASYTIEGRSRFNEVTIFRDLKPINDSTRARSQDNFAWWSDVIDNRRIYFLHEYLVNYFDAFNPSFLFYSGDINPRLSTQGVGELYYFELILLLAGTYSIVKNKEKYTFLIFGWLLISPLGPATARETPHALRMAHILPTFQIISAYGLYYLLNRFKFRTLMIISTPLLIGLSVFAYLHFYHVHYPKEYSGEWQYGYKEAINEVAAQQSKVGKVVISNHIGRAYINLLFYSKVDPADYIAKANVTRDEQFFYNVQGYDKYIFTDHIEEFNSANTLYVSSPGHLPSSALKLKTVYNLNNYPVFEVGIIP